MNLSETPTIIVIVGITGDLAKRKLLPAIDQLSQAGALPRNFRIVGITRRSDVQTSSLIKAIADPTFIEEHTELFRMNLTEIDGYDQLATRLQEIENDWGAPAQCLFYLSVPPQVSQPIIRLLGESGLAHRDQTKLLVEKPFGVDLASAADLVEHIDAHFSPEQVYRIDHYLAKEMAQNILTFREENVLFKQTWNKDFIKSIRITASEQIDIEGRAQFYEQTGALRDLVQSHLLQLAALVLMDIPELDRLSEVPARRLEALQLLHVAPDKPITESVTRGQYEGYREQVGSPGTATETFVKLTLQSANPRWQDVPVILATGKALKEKCTEIRIMYRQVEGRKANELVLRLQPNEGAEMCLWAKRPGYQQQIERRSLQFSYPSDERLPEAYERVFLDAIRSDHTLFVTSQEVLETWRILAPIQHAWEMDEHDLGFYKPGTDIHSL